VPDAGISDVLPLSLWRILVTGTVFLETDRLVDVSARDVRLER